VSGGTDNHLMLVDVNKKGLTGKACAEALDRAAITVNKNAIPFDTQSPFKAGGIRLGTPAVTTRGMKEKEMADIARFINEVLSNIEDEKKIAGVREEVRTLTKRFVLYPDLLKKFENDGRS
jgi:glycine hydroxymethyltransferase